MCFKAYSKYKKRIPASIVLLILLVSFVACVYLQVRADTSPSFSDGFESNNFNAWTGRYGDIVTSDAYPHHGTYAANWTSGGGGYCYKTVAGQTTLYMRAYFYFTSVPNTGTYSSILSLMDTNGWLISEVWFRVSGGVTRFWLYSCQDYDLTDTGITISPNTWYCVELASYKNAAGWNKIWVNGVLTSHNVDNSGFGNIIRGYLGAFPRTGAAYKAYGDCAVINSSYIGLETSDSDAPTYSDISVSNASAWTTKAPLPRPLADSAAAVYDGKLYYFGGYGDNANDVRAEVYCYDPSTDSWSTKTSMNHATWGHTAAEYNGVIYVFGGVTGYTQAYNISTDSWTDKTGPPSNLLTYLGLMAVTVGDRIYLFNGYSTYEYNPSTDVFTQKANAPVPRSFATCAYTIVMGEDRIYIIGGSNPSSGPTNVNYYYRPSNNDWSSAQAAAPYTVYGVPGNNPVSEGLIYYGFGFDASTTFYSRLYAYNAAANTWSSALPSASYPRDGVACGVINNKLYVVGGRNVTTAPYGVNFNEEYTPSSVSSLRSFDCKWTDKTGLSGYIFGTNNTGTFVNDTWTGFLANPSWASVTKTLNTTATAVTYQWWANDTSNNWNNTGLQTLIVYKEGYALTVNALGSGSVNLNSSGPYDFGDVVELTAVPSSGWVFSGWSGDLSGSLNPDSITMDDDKFVTATFTEIQYALTTNVVGSGSVDKVPNQPTYSQGTSVQLTAVPSEGWRFDGWSGDLSGSTNPATIIIDGDMSVTATFSQIEYTLTVNVVGSGSVSKIPDQLTYHYGDSVTLTATAAAGWSFNSATGWSGDGSTDGSGNRVVSITGNMAVTATFTQNVYSLTVNVVGSGSVNLNNSGPYHFGDVVELTAVPSAGWSFSGWSGDLSGNLNPDSLNVTGDMAVTATFTRYAYSVVATVEGVGGTITPSGTILVNEGEDATFNITAEPGYHILNVNVDGIYMGPQSSFTFSDVQEDHNITAIFAKTEFTLTIIVSGGGRIITDLNKISYDYGDTVTLTAIPNSNWVFSGWSGDLTGTTNPATIVMDSNKTIYVTFTEN